MWAHLQPAGNLASCCRGGHLGHISPGIKTTIVAPAGIGYRLMKVLHTLLGAISDLQGAIGN